MILFDTETRERIGEYRAPGCVTWLGFDPRDGSLAIVGGLGPRARIPGRHRRRHPTAAQLGLARRLSRRSWEGLHPHGTYAPDGRSVIVSYARFSGPTAHVFLRRFDARTASPIGPAVRVAPRSDPWPPPAGMTPDGRLLIASDRRPTRSTRTRCASCAAIRSALYTTGISPDGDTLALGGEDGRVRLLDLASGRVRTLTGGRHDGEVNREAFSPDGRTLATADDATGT